MTEPRNGQPAEFDAYAGDYDAAHRINRGIKVRVSSDAVTPA